MNITYRKVGLMAYLFLFVGILPAFTQHQPAWEHPSYVQIFTLDLSHDRDLSSPEIAYINGYKDAVSNLLQENPKAGEVISYLEQAMEAIRISSLPSPYREYYLNDLYLWQALMELKSGNELKFMWMLNQLYRRSVQLMDNHRDFSPSLKIHALMQIMIGSVPGQYQWIFNLLGYEGNTEKGISLLKSFSRSDTPLRYEGMALYSLVTNYLQPELSNAETELPEKYSSRHVNLQLLHFVTGLSLLKQHQSLKARPYFEELTHRKDFPVFNYFLAETYLHEGHYEHAISNYHHFLEHTRGKNLIKDSYTKIFLSYYMQNKVKEAAKYKELAKAEGVTLSETDKNAREILQSDPLPHPDLFRIRFMTDGGFYENALAVITTTDQQMFSARDKVELIYRRARTFHLSGHTDGAIQDYLLSLKYHDGRYFAPNSALQLGYIFQKQGDDREARRYFEKVLEYSDYTYEQSIRSKARGALKNLNNP